MDVLFFAIMSGMKSMCACAGIIMLDPKQNLQTTVDNALLQFYINVAIIQYYQKCAICMKSKANIDIFYVHIYMIA